VSVGHYENFPVASALLPKRYRRAIVAIYRFARAADDIADEGHASPSERLAGLARLQDGLDAIERGLAPDDASLDELARVIREHALPLPPFRDLLSAFAQDVTIGRYRTFDELLDYCRRSANPVGRLLLALYRVDDSASARQSDAICTALQLANFWQDVAIDWGRGRVYIPLEDLQRFDVDVEAMESRRFDTRWKQLMQFQTRRTREWFDAGVALPRRLPWRAGIELRAVIAGGRRILDRIDAVQGDVFGRRPTLALRDWLVVACRTLRPSRPALATT
jgi:squalene synthase HpnC